MSTLERRCQLLLHAYPAGYREARGEEIIGTLLEATPPGRSWPLPRDVGGLLLGGLRARAAQPSQFSAPANVRVAVFAGVAAYPAWVASVYLSSYVHWAIMPGQWHEPFGWFAAAMLPLIPMALAWLSRRRLIVLAGALPAAAATCYVGPWHGFSVGSTVVGLACLAALVALAGYAERPSWRWFWPLGLLAIAPLPAAVAEGFATISAGNILAPLALALEILIIAWMVIDARPAIATAVLLLAGELPLTIGLLAAGDGIQVSALLLPVVAAITAVTVTAVAVWRLRRQSGGSGSADAGVAR